MLTPANQTITRSTRRVSACFLAAILLHCRLALNHWLLLRFKASLRISRSDWVLGRASCSHAVVWAHESIAASRSRSGQCLSQMPRLPADTTLLSTFSSKAPSLPVAPTCCSLEVFLGIWPAVHMHLLVIHCGKYICSSGDCHLAV